MIVVDTHILAYLCLEGQHTLRAEAARRKDRYWVAPRLWRSEFRNVLAQYLRRRILTLQNATQIMDHATKLMEGCEYDVSSLYVLNLVAASSCSAYDCEFVALAQDLEVPLVTTDRQVLDQFPEVAFSLDAFLLSKNG